jgi:Ser/Thr protein kinase RdoA (MazF antagonist)
MEWVDAPLLMDRLPGPDRQPDITRVGAWLARLHATTAKHPLLAPRQRGVPLPDVETGGLAEEVARSLRERMGALRLRSGPTAMLHGDFHPGNLFVSGKRILAFDRKYDASGTIFFDIATFLVDIAHLRNLASTAGKPWPGNMEADRQSFFAGYGAISEKHLALHDLIEDLIVFRRWYHRFVQQDEHRWFEEQLRVRGLPDRAEGIARPGRLVSLRRGGAQWSTEPTQ